MREIYMYFLQSQCDDRTAPRQHNEKFCNSQLLVPRPSSRPVYPFRPRQH